MTIIYTVKDGRYSYHMDSSKPRPKNKSISGFAYSFEAMERAVRGHLGDGPIEWKEVNEWPVMIEHVEKDFARIYPFKGDKMSPDLTSIDIVVNFFPREPHRQPYISIPNLQVNPEGLRLVIQALVRAAEIANQLKLGAGEEAAV